MLRIQLLGQFKVTLDEQPIKLAPRLRRLLTYLVLNNRAHSREMLIQHLWPTEEGSERFEDLRSMLAKLRQSLGESYARPSRLLGSDLIRFVLQPGDSVDVLELEHVDPATADLAQLTRLSQAFALPADDVADEFTPARIERTTRCYCGVIAQLSRMHREHANFGAAKTVVARWHDVAPEDEDAYIEEMHVHALTGDEDAVIGAFERCQSATQMAPSQRLWKSHIRMVELARSQIDEGLIPENNLPVFDTDFIGRSDELETIRSLLIKPGNSLVTILGAGGMGKTRLAVAATAGMMRVFADGVYFVDIEGATEFSQVWQRIADVIGYRFFGSDAPPEQLLRVFRERRTLLILDGFEHTQLGDAQLACVTWIDKLIRQCHSLRILTTSRHRLMSAHETVVELGGLAIASGVNSDLMKERGDAIDLFLSAAARRSGDAPSLPHVARICRLVGGMPLAIEIAACWTRVMSCQRIADDIEREHGRLLRSTETPDGDPSNALRIQACLEYAWQQLMPHEQLLYAALSELDSHFDADAACFTGKTATSAIMALLDKSILHKALPSRFAMHSVIRMFGREKGRAVLVATSETQQRIIDYFIGVAQSRQADPDQLNLECENFSTALRLAQAHQRWRTLLDLVSLIAEHWYLRSRYSDAALGHALAEEAARQLSDRKALLQALRWQGRMQLEQGAYQRAERMLEEALGHAYSEEDELEIGLVHYDQAWCAIETGHGDRADALIAQSLELLQPGQHDYARAQVYNLASRRLLDRNDIAGAIQSAQSAVTLLEPINAWAHLAHAYKWLAEAYQADKNWEESRRWTTRALETSTHAQDAFAVASCKYVAARLQYLTASELESGLKLALEAQAEFARIGVPKSAAYAQDLAGLLNAKLGNLIEARRLIAHSLDQIVAMDDTWATVNLRMHLGDVERDLGKLGAARQLWQTALDTARAIEHPFVDALNERLAAQHG